jgi:class 3 adenylate cyclase
MAHRIVLINLSKDRVLVIEHDPGPRPQTNAPNFISEGQHLAFAIVNNYAVRHLAIAAVPMENPALRAVLMALELREAIGTLTGKWRRFGHDIGFGIGIAHGFATLGTIGFEGRFDYAAIGTVSNVASRLCGEAKPGQILINPRVLVAVEDAVMVEPIGEFELKGIRRPLAAYNVVAAVSSNI